ncbi:Lipase 3 [Blattella germanica]|nr:Lipase 3 [Blattella germanica]
MHRITGSPKFNSTTKKKPVVFLQHGLFSTSADWIILGPGKSLGYLLADEGYDVWMGNARGNRYSRGHAKYRPTNLRYWDFSWHEMGVFDLPAEIDYILKVTGQKKINYVGHSMGTTMFFVLTSQKPEYNEKIRHMIALAPIAYMKRTRNALTVLGSALHVAQVRKHSRESIRNIGTQMSEMHRTNIVRVYSHFNTVVFRQFDYYFENKARYGQITPPDYNLNAITAPITLFYGDNDLFTDPEDILPLSIALPNAKAHHVNFKLFNHMDFLWANDVKSLVNNEVIRRLK